MDKVNGKIISNSNIFSETFENLMTVQMYSDQTCLPRSLDEQENNKPLMGNEANCKVSEIGLIRSKSKLIGNRYENNTIFPSSNIFPDTPITFETIVSIHNTADVLKALLDLSNVVFYLAASGKDKLFLVPRDGNSLTTNLSWKIESGSTMASFAAFHKTYITTKNVSADERFPLGLGYISSMINYAMCVPIMCPDNQVLGVFELSRFVGGQAFNKKDIQTVLVVTSWMGVSMSVTNSFVDLQWQQELTDSLLELTHHCHSADKKASTPSDFGIIAKEFLGAEQSTLLIVEKDCDNGLLVREHDLGADEGSSTEANFDAFFKRHVQRMISHENIVLGPVLFQKKTIIIESDAKDVTELNQPWQSILCAPILNHDKVIGAIQLTNKMSGQKFNEKDKLNLELFAKFCSINVNHLNMLDVSKKTENELAIHFEMLHCQMKPCVHDEMDIPRYSYDTPDLTEQYFSFSWYPVAYNNSHLVGISIKMFHKILGKSFMALYDVPTFLMTVQRCYRQNIYHNFTHGVKVTHAMMCILSRHSKEFSKMECKGLMIAAMCHGLDHRGYSNNFIKLTNHYLSSLYSTSYLENHNFVATKIVIEQCGMCQYLKPSNYNDLMKEIYECIIATDLSFSFHNRTELFKIVQNGTFTFDNTEHRRHIKNIMMTTCNLIENTMQFAVSKKIIDNFYVELYQQGDMLRKMGFQPEPKMDRNHIDLIPKNQVQFLITEVIPCLEILSLFFHCLDCVLQETKVNLIEWEKIVEIMNQECWKPEESYVYT